MTAVTCPVEAAIKDTGFISVAQQSIHQDFSRAPVVTRRIYDFTFTIPQWFANNHGSLLALIAPSFQAVIANRSPFSINFNFNATKSATYLSPIHQSNLFLRQLCGDKQVFKFKPVETSTAARGATSDLTPSSSLIVSLIMLSFDDSLLSKTVIFVIWN